MATYYYQSYPGELPHGRVVPRAGDYWRTLEGDLFMWNGRRWCATLDAPSEEPSSDELAYVRESLGVGVEVEL